MRGADQCNVITLHWSTSIRLSRRMTAWFRQPITLVRSNNRAAGQTSGDGQPGGAASSKISKAPSAPINLVRTDLRQCHCGSVPKLVGVVCQIVPRFEIRPPDVVKSLRLGLEREKATGIRQELWAAMAKEAFEADPATRN